MTDDLPVPSSRGRRARRLSLLAAGLVSFGLWSGVAGASDAPAESTAAVATVAPVVSVDATGVVTVDLPGWDGQAVGAEAAALLARIAASMPAAASVGDDGNRWTGVGEVGNRWTGVGDVGNRWTGTLRIAIRGGRTS